jgi:hypothetical protein
VARAGSPRHFMTRAELRRWIGKAGEAFVVECLDGGQVGGDDVQELSGSPKSRCAGCCGRLTSRQKERELSERKRVE